VAERAGPRLHAGRTSRSGTRLYPGELRGVSRPEWRWHPGASIWRAVSSVGRRPTRELIAIIRAGIPGDDDAAEAGSPKHRPANDRGVPAEHGSIGRARTRSEGRCSDRCGAGTARGWALFHQQGTVRRLPPCERRRPRASPAGPQRGRAPSGRAPRAPAEAARSERAHAAPGNRFIEAVDAWTAPESPADCSIRDSFSIQADRLPASGFLVAAEVEPAGIRFHEDVADAGVFATSSPLTKSADLVSYPSSR